MFDLSDLSLPLFQKSSEADASVFRAVNCGRSSLWILEQQTPSVFLNERLVFLIWGNPTLLCLVISLFGLHF